MDIVRMGVEKKGLKSGWVSEKDIVRVVVVRRVKVRVGVGEGI